MAKEKMFRGETFKSPKCRLSFAQSLFTARAPDPKKPDVKKFGCTLIFEKSDGSILEKYLRETIMGQWGEKGVERAKIKKIKNPILLGWADEAKDDDGKFKPGLGPDKIYLRVSTATIDGVPQPPAVWYKDPNVHEKEDVVFSGCFVKAVLNAYAWTHDTGGDGVSFGLVGIQKMHDGDRLGGERPSATKYHETVEDLGDAPSETKDGAGAGGLFGG